MNKTDSDAIKGIAIIMLYMHHLYHSDRWKSYEIVWGGGTIRANHFNCRVLQDLCSYICIYFCLWNK